MVGVKAFLSQRENLSDKDSLAYVGKPENKYIYHLLLLRRHTLTFEDIKNKVFRFLILKDR